MAKRGKRGGSGLGNLGGMMQQMQKMQADMQQAQQELENEMFEISVGGGAMTVVISGHQRVQEIKINPDIIDTDDDEWLTDLQDLLVAGVNQAIEESQTEAARRMESITGNIDVGGLPGGLGGLLGG